MSRGVGEGFWEGLEFLARSGDRVYGCGTPHLGSPIWVGV